MTRARKDAKSELVKKVPAAYEKPQVKTLERRDVVRAVNKGSKFPARGFAG